jgi:predicted NUDIX family NTP pyrophosphohydrolase
MLDTRETSRMASTQSAGILAYRQRDGSLEVFLVHPGGPYWKNKDAGAWSIPKGEFADGESPLAAAQREFMEETGARIDGDFQPLPVRRTRSGKRIHAWAIEAAIDPDKLQSNFFAMEWPPGSGQMQEFPEVDKGAWFPVAQALAMINAGQRPFLADLQKLLGAPFAASAHRAGPA